MHPSRTRRTARAIREFAQQSTRWVPQRRRAALSHLLRGVCYGIGTGAISLIVLWIQHGTR
ncbi:hypothetical protein QWM81_12840 [Streptomyces ficellus]|uniref:Uncharacterized protein n=1 Tax=Streptomyces ficellus TaxID=1977088 RepID=A0ABT7Z5Z6_9ACTN|nr:hypothetical protein [Streptomyces ficellus]MDN3294922.1 hypothetical protein [Streptomyces ficellus]